jgi:hypothetical protein
MSTWKEQINNKPGSLTHQELELLHSQLKQRTTASLVVRYNSLAKTHRRTKTDKAEFLLIRNILNDRDRQV